MFETNLREERLLPFEGAGVESTWKLELPKDFRQFDYNTISDLILHFRYTARQGGDQVRSKAIEHLENMVSEANSAGLALLFSLKNDFLNEWHQFVTGAENFKALVKQDHFPYFTQGKDISIDALQLHVMKAKKVEVITLSSPNLTVLTDDLNENKAFELSLSPDTALLNRDKDAIVFILVKYSLG